MHRLDSDAAVERAEAQTALRRAPGSPGAVSDAGGRRLPPRRREGIRRGASHRGAGGRGVPAGPPSSASAWRPGSTAWPRRPRSCAVTCSTACGPARPRGEELLAAMEDVYDLLVTIEYPDAITGGLRRSADAFEPSLSESCGCDHHGAPSRGCSKPSKVPRCWSFRRARRRRGRASICPLPQLGLSG